MGGVYQITNRGKDEEITHSTYLLRSIGEGIREEWNIYLSIRFRSRNGENVQLLGTFFPIIRNKMFKFLWNIYVPHQNRTYFWESRTSDYFPSSSDHPLDIHWTYWWYALTSRIISNGYPVTIRMSCLMTIVSGYSCNKLILSQKRFASTEIWNSYLRLVIPPC